MPKQSVSVAGRWLGEVDGHERPPLSSLSNAFQCFFGALYVKRPGPAGLDFIDSGLIAQA
jgi:hypothetical protein